MDMTIYDYGQLWPNDPALSGGNGLKTLVLWPYNKLNRCIDLVYRDIKEQVEGRICQQIVNVVQHQVALAKMPVSSIVESVIDEIVKSRLK